MKMDKLYYSLYEQYLEVLTSYIKHYNTNMVHSLIPRLDFIISKHSADNTDDHMFGWLEEHYNIKDFLNNKILANEILEASDMAYEYRNQIIKDADDYDNEFYRYAERYRPTSKSSS